MQPPGQQRQELALQRDKDTDTPYLDLAVGRTEAGLALARSKVPGTAAKSQNKGTWTPGKCLHAAGMSLTLQYNL